MQGKDTKKEVDVRGRGLDLELTGGVTVDPSGAITSDPGDHALRFDGETGFASLSQAASSAFTFGGSQPFSIELWAKLAATQSESGSYHHLIGCSQVLGYQDSGTPNRNGFLFYLVDETGGLQFNYDCGDSCVALLTVPEVTETSFTHYVIVFDGTKLTPWVDRKSGPPSSEPPSSMSTRLAKLVIGREQGHPSHFFAGTIDEVAIYDKALSSAAISHHYETATKPP
jgi:hypothetical protein